MLRTARVTLVTLAVLGGLASVPARGPSPAASAKSAATATAPRVCTTRGARWTWGREKGDRYRVFPAGTTCSFAQQWSARLSYRRPVVSGGLRVIRGGPTGWTCYTRFSVPFPRATTPAVAAGVTDHVWTLDELIGLLEATEAVPIKRGSYAKTRAVRREAEISK